MGRTVWVLLLCVGLLPCHSIAQNAKAPEGNSELLGEWSIQRMIFKGDEQDFGELFAGVIRFTETKIGFQYRKDGKFVENDLTVRPDRSPKEFDIKDPAFKEPNRGIYSLRGDTLVIVYTERVKDDRPTHFDAAKNSHWTYYELKKRK